MAHTVLRNSLSKLAPLLSDVPLALLVLKFALLDGGWGCREQAPRDDVGKGRVQRWAGWWLPRGKKRYPLELFSYNGRVCVVSEKKDISEH